MVSVDGNLLVAGCGGEAIVAQRGGDRLVHQIARVLTCLLLGVTKIEAFCDGSWKGSKCFSYSSIHLLLCRREGPLVMTFSYMSLKSLSSSAPTSAECFCISAIVQSPCSVT